MTTTDEPPHKVVTLAELQKALDLVHASVLAEARMRGWCSEYEEIVDRINSKVGMEVLGKRMRRQTITATVTLRVRGPYTACDAAYAKFREYVNKYNDVALVDCAINVSNGETSEVAEETLTPPPVEEAPPNLPGWDPLAGCNCEDCRRERVQRAQLRAEPRAVDPRAIPRPPSARFLAREDG